MTFPMDALRTCAVCGHKSSQLTLASSNSFGPADLDMRPAPMLRDTMHMWVERCPECGYVASQLSARTSVTEKFLQSESYRTCDGLGFDNPLAEKFYRQALILTADKDIFHTFHALLHAAWACDDCADTENAVRCRILALVALEGVLADKDTVEDLHLLKADLLRRSGQFDKVESFLSGREFDSPLLNDVAAFQLEKARQRDIGCYNMGDVKAFRP